MISIGNLEIHHDGNHENNYKQNFQTKLVIAFPPSASIGSKRQLDEQQQSSSTGHSKLRK